jgi:ribosome biogenesis GTPase
VEVGKALVIKSTGSWYVLKCTDGSIVTARAKGKLRLLNSKNTNPIAVGDYVHYEKIDENFNIYEIEPRNNYIIRKSNKSSKQTHIVASNLDNLLIVATWVLPRTSLGFIDRLLVTAEAYHIKPIIVFNKLDLYKELNLLEEIEQIRNIYEPLGYPFHVISAKTKEGINLLEQEIQNKTTLISGHSGVGKSSLINVLLPDMNLKIGNISSYSLKGKHTTTFAEMFELNSTTYLIDTPGIKDFGMLDFEDYEIAHFFPEMKAYLDQCKFNNCLHVQEPGCKIKEIIQHSETDISPSRYNSYLSILYEEETHK